MMKVALFLALFHKHDVVLNTLYSILRQKPPFDVQVCIVDDDPEHPHEATVKALCSRLGKIVRYYRPEKNLGHHKALGECWRLMDPDTDVIILQSSDVLHASDDTIQQLVENTEPGICTLAEVRNVEVPNNLYRDWHTLPYYTSEERLSETLKAINEDPLQPERGKYTLAHTIFSGKRAVRPDHRWYFFLGAIRKEDLEKTNFRSNCLDLHLNADLRRSGMQCRYVDVIGIHQKHPIVKHKGGW